MKKKNKDRYYACKALVLLPRRFFTGIAGGRSFQVREQLTSQVFLGYIFFFIFKQRTYITLTSMQEESSDKETELCSQAKALTTRHPS